MYGNGTDKKIECIVKDEDGFNKWFEEHNNEREEMGEEPESREEFTLIPVNLFG
jgi:hypothetical protein